MICALAENDGITFDACLYLVLQVLGLLPQILVNISFQAPIPLTLAYCPESMVYQKWHPEQGGIAPLHKEIRVAQTLSKVLGGIAEQLSKGKRHSGSLASSGAMWAVSWTVSPLHPANDQAPWIRHQGTIQCIPAPMN